MFPVHVQNGEDRDRPDLDLNHTSTLRSKTDSDRKAFEELIARLDKFSPMGTVDRTKDEQRCDVPIT